MQPDLIISSGTAPKQEPARTARAAVAVGATWPANKGAIGSMRPDPSSRGAASWAYHAPNRRGALTILMVIINMHMLLALIEPFVLTLKMHTDMGDERGIRLRCIRLGDAALRGSPAKARHLTPQSWLPPPKVDFGTRAA